MLERIRQIIVQHFSRLGEIIDLKHLLFGGVFLYVKNVLIPLLCLIKKIYLCSAKNDMVVYDGPKVFRINKFQH